MNPRQRRLEGDYSQIVTRFSGSPHVSVLPVGPFPYDRYRVLYAVPGLRLDATNTPRVVQPHIVDIYLPAGYPREKPYATTVEPVFHPNFGEHICLADFWSPAQSLADIIVQIADMLQYRRYNIRSPLNAVAAEWANRFRASLPIGNYDIAPADVQITVAEPIDVHTGGLS